MADVFISYAREDRTQARDISIALFGLGVTAFWDWTITPGSNWRDQLVSELLACDCVVVLWSVASVQSDWVRQEASLGLQRNILVPAQLDYSALPYDFSSLQTAQLQRWSLEMSVAIEPFFWSRIMDLVGTTPQSLMVANPRPESVANDNSLYQQYMRIWLEFQSTPEPSRYADFASAVEWELARYASSTRPDKHLRNLQRAIRAYFRLANEYARSTPPSLRKHFKKVTEDIEARFLACTSPEEFDALHEELEVLFPPQR